VRPPNTSYVTDVFVYIVEHSKSGGGGGGVDMSSKSPEAINKKKGKDQRVWDLNGKSGDIADLNYSKETDTVAPENSGISIDEDQVLTPSVSLF